MTLQYEDIYKLFLGSVQAYSWLKVSTEVAYEYMLEYLHKTYALPYVRSRFTSISLDDELMTITCELEDSVDDDYDKYFVSELVFAKGMIVFWLEDKKNTETLLNYAVFGKEEKVASPYGQLAEIKEAYNKARIEHEKLLLKHGYWNSSYLAGGAL